MRLTTRRRKVLRPDLDRNAVRYFIYRLHDSAGQVLYVGRSCNVSNRLRAHYSEATGQYGDGGARKALWFQDVRRVSMVGPFNWGDACRREREEIEAHQPVGNRMFTERHGWLRSTA